MIKIPEKFITSQKIQNEYIEVFANPTLKELKSIAGDDINMGFEMADKGEPAFRYLADDKTKTVYAWPPYITHETFLRKSNLNLYPQMKVYEAKTPVIIGTAIIIGTKTETISTHFIDLLLEDEGFEYEVQERIISLITRDWSWADKYVGLTKYLRNKDYEGIIESGDF